VRLSFVILAALAAGCAPQPEQFSTAIPSLHVGEVAIDGGEPAIALSVAAAHLASAPGDPNALLLRARAEFALGHPALAEADFRQVLAIRPGSAEAALGLARIITATDPAAAEAVLAPIAARGDATAAIWNNLGVAHDLMGRHAEAQDAYRKALAADPEMQGAQVNLARSLALTPAPRP
jgi:tetratricopeptide (TPR) repeat protein